MPTATVKNSYKSFFKNGDGKVHQDLPLPIHEDVLVIGMEWKSVDIPELLNSLPYYSPFRNCEDYYFDLDEYDKLVNFVVNETFYPEGENTGIPFIPERWQWACLLNIFCWKHNETHRRRYREAFIYVPRKNGKTTGFGVICTLYMFFVDGEQRSQNFCCAADVEQASVNFRHVAFNIEQNPRLINRLVNKRVNRGMKTFEHVDGSMFKVLSSIADTKHGLSPNFVYIDEVHAHKNGDLIDVMVTGTAARSQSLIIYTTTSDYDRVSICNDMYARAKNVALGVIDDPSFFPVIYEADRDDDYTSYKVWKKANPNFGISIYPDYFQRQIAICKSNPSLLNRFLRLHLNIKTKTETVWIPPWIWANGTTEETDLLTVEEIKNKLYEFRQWHNFATTAEWFNNPQTDLYLNDFRNYYTWYFRKVEELRYEECYGAYDNASNNDIAAFTLYFPNTGVLLSWFWVPATSIYRRSHEERIPYDRWYQSGLINNTPLECISEINVIETLVGEQHGLGICKYFRELRHVGFDRWGANFIHESLYNYGIPAKGYPQSFAGMNSPCRKLEAMITNKELFHGGNPVTDWMMNNTMIQRNNSNQIRVDKVNSTDKVDGIVTSVMAIGVHIYIESDTITSISGLSDDV